MLVACVLLLFICPLLIPGTWALGCRIVDRRREPTSVSPDEEALAEERSNELLRDLLSEREYQQLMEQGYLDIASPSYAERTYRIPRLVGRVQVYEHGRELVELCVQPVVPLPANDVIVLHKLMIECNEQGYLARANEILLTDQPWWLYIAR